MNASTISCFPSGSPDVKSEHFLPSPAIEARVSAPIPQLPTPQEARLILRPTYHTHTTCNLDCSSSFSKPSPITLHSLGQLEQPQIPAVRTLNPPLGTSIPMWPC